MQVFYLLEASTDGLVVILTKVRNDYLHSLVSPLDDSLEAQDCLLRVVL
jgi:hypothetical protein